MAKRVKSKLELIAEALRVADLRLRLAPDLGQTQRSAALRELRKAGKDLGEVVKEVVKRKYNGWGDL